MKTKLYTLAYALVLGSVCALMLASTGELTAPYRAANAKADKIRNILTVLGVDYPSDASADHLLSVFDETVQQVEQGDMTLYKVKRSGAVAVPFSGAGLWGPIKGFLALESDMSTIRGITFHEQEETPGLGGEIASEGFRSQFEGKKIMSEQGEAGIRIVRRKAVAQNEVDAISGATMTCDKVQKMLNETVRKIVDVR